MPGTELLLAFALATFLFAVFPGPALLYTAARTLAGGRTAGFMAALGIHLGCYVHVIAATLGLSAIFRHVPEAYLALKLVGAAYLIWLGIGMIRSKALSADLPAVERKGAGRAFVESIVVEVLNPKVAIFFVAFLPQFVDPQAALPIWAQFLILGTIVNFAFSSADIVTVFLTSSVMGALRRTERAQRWLKWVGGTVLAGLGVRLALDRS